MPTWKKVTINFLYLIHLAIVIIWFGLFFVPKFLWPGRVTFHFWFIFIFMLIQMGWGAAMMPYMKKYRIVCPLTTLMQKLRGYPFGDKKNFDHSFIREFLANLKIQAPYGSIGLVNYLSLGLITIQYLLFRN
ncbi:MAG: hypothetical protein V1892_02445 [bacterium]